MFCPATTESGVSVLGTTGSAEAGTRVASVAVWLALMGSVVVVLTFAVLLIDDAFATLGLTVTTRTKVGAAPAAKLDRVEVMRPVPPTGGVVEVQPAGAVNDTKVVPAGTRSVSATLCAGLA